MPQRAPGFYREIPPNIFLGWRAATILRLLLTDSWFLPRLVAFHALPVCVASALAHLTH